MDDGKMTEFLIKLNAELAALNANMKNVLDKLTQHEQRLIDLERGKGQEQQQGLKDAAIMWLVKGLVAATLTIGSLTGAAGLIKGIFAQ